MCMVFCLAVQPQERLEAKPGQTDANGEAGKKGAKGILQNTCSKSTFGEYFEPIELNGLIVLYSFLS